MSERYKAAGVNIDAGNEAVARIRRHVAKTLRPEVLGGLGGFGAGFRFPAQKYKDPVLVSGTDGVGTKLKIAFAMQVHHTIGIDAVAMCVNDVLAQGAEPLFFLDYLATGRLVPEIVERIVEGVAEGCVQAGCALIGGETAEMPGMYAEGEYDIAGFCVGVVERDRYIDGSAIVPGDTVIGLASSGIHSNGYSLVRKVLLEEGGFRLDQVIPPLEKPLGEELLTPTRIYAKSVLALAQKYAIKGLAHITGGGILENVPRILPARCHVVLDPQRWTLPDIFALIADTGRIPARDMFRTFNMGIGMVCVVDPDVADAFVTDAQAQGEQAFVIGVVEEGERGISIGGVAP